jgi:glycosyltransferase involved in cell wall biosynthesis
VLSGHDVICISSIDWGFLWQGHQEIMARLAAAGNRVLFIENTGVRPPGRRDLPRLLQRLRNWRRGRGGVRLERPNLWVWAPLALPLPYSPAAVRLNRVLLLSVLRRWLRRQGWGQPLVWTFLPTPLARALIRALDPQLVVYYCIDDLASSSPAAAPIAASERRLFREADLVFVTSERLRARAARDARAVHLFPFAVNYAQFAAAREDPAPPPADLARLPRPIVGYLGGLHQWVDQDLLAAVARRLPQCSFALIGPAQVEVSRLAALPNVHLLGPRPHAQVPYYLKGFDVALVPYKRADYTAHVYPTKLNEYLAMGLPVVCTDLDEIRRFNTTHGPTVAIARDAEEYAAAISAALAPAAPAVVEHRLAVARANSWDARLAAMSALIAARLEQLAEQTSRS